MSVAATTTLSHLHGCVVSEFDVHTRTTQCECMTLVARTDLFILWPEEKAAPTHPHLLWHLPTYPHPSCFT